ncbi:hypothetical protein A3D11_02255 [Candidatus Peribacteria bacterium RIFCSPHIGHO2_02_FULL_49_16]|nr:MAG: hypothetical protein A2880_03715 [Candidatus Peribacteria bacterium RIFCSPHIGHO2_01_FULL_49_38]OGJ59948.1 MAG: hypothetical protein A3D11_02255 [Candidatus Peribacteria bacterium RIFCSPHIGHO2_02_FULL_49_16]
MYVLSITAFYKFIAIQPKDLPIIQEKLMKFGKERDMRGLVLLAEEGINGTVSGKSECICEWKELLEKYFGEITFKDSEANTVIFPRWFVKIREEIVNLKKPDVRPTGKYHHLSPERWDRMMEEDDVLVIDLRNDYETEIGTFEGAMDLKVKEFHEFPRLMKQANLPKDKRILLYCTGGIRCEKASLEMEKQGYEHVYQLDGGILAYLKTFPYRKFKGECFVFDHRVAVDQELKPSERFHVCPHCGDPGDREIVCAKCEKNQFICAKCFDHTERRSCSKNCRHHLGILVK